MHLSPIDIFNCGLVSFLFQPDAEASNATSNATSDVNVDINDVNDDDGLEQNRTVGEKANVVMT